MTKHHEIDLEGFQSWLDEAELLFAFSTRERKKLVVSAKGNIMVKVNDKVVWRGVQPYSAVEEYNKIDKPFKN